MSHVDLGMPTSMPTGSIPFVTPPPATAKSMMFLRPFTVDEFHRMAESGVLRADERVELLEGIITMMSPIGAPHATCVELLNRAFVRVLSDQWCYRAQHPIVTGDSEPQPDGCVARGDLRTYGDRHPGLNEVALAIEVADTTLATDRTLKARVYAAAGIAEYWIVNLVDKKLEVHRRPIAAVGEQPARYETVESLGVESSVPVTFDGSQVGTIAVRDILP